MNKKDLAEIVSLESGLTINKALKVINSVFETIGEKTLNGENVELRGFGTFYLKEQKPREIFSPVLQKKVDVASNFKVMFKPGKALRKNKGD